MAKKFTYYGSDEYILNDKSILFPGVNQAVNIDATLTGLATNTQGTWSMWVKPVDSTPASTGGLMGFGDTNVTELIQINNATNGKLRASCYVNNVNQWIFDSNSAVFSSGVWTHVFLTHNGTTPALYINNVSAPITFVISIDKTKWFNSASGLDNGRIGCLNFNSAGDFVFYKGNIDEVSLFNKALDATERTELYNTGIPNNVLNHSASANLVTYYRMGDATLDTNLLIEDLKNGYDATGINLVLGDIVNDVP